MNHCFPIEDRMLSRTAEHAVRAAIFLARQDEGRPVSAEVIASNLDAPRNYMRKTLGSLASQGIVISSPGRNGGFRLAVPAAELSVGQIIDAVNPPRRRRMCLLGGRLCDSENPCGAHQRWKAVLDVSRGYVGSLTIAQLIADQTDEAVSTTSSQVGK